MGSEGHRCATIFLERDGGWGRRGAGYVVAMVVVLSCGRALIFIKLCVPCPLSSGPTYLTLPWAWRAFACAIFAWPGMAWPCLVFCLAWYFLRLHLKQTIIPAHYERVDKS